MMWIGLLCLLALVSGHVRIDPLVLTKVGLIRGLRTDDGYSKFMGIPYALVDEANHFGRSVPHPEFDDVFEAYDDTIKCPQVDEGEVTGIIQCLSLNIFVPNTATSHNRLPVMVWIHGGAYTKGSAHAVASNPVDLLKNDVILVALNYRLGVYGFMCLDIPEVPGNQGLKDQVLALRWINDNIEAFGGDATKITVFGESAGGMSINLHLFSLNEKLFNKAIIQSGPALSPWLMTESNIHIPLTIAEKLGFETTDISSALSFLSTVDAQLVVATAYNEKMYNFDANNVPMTLPCIEKPFEDVENFITAPPINIKPTKNVPLIIGYNNNELGFLLEMVAPEYIDGYKFDTELQRGFQFDENLNEALEAITHFYIGDEMLGEDLRSEITDFASDFIFAHPTQRMTEKLLDDGYKDVYRYIFSYNGSKNHCKIALNMSSPGATHGDELGYLFDFKFSEETTEDRLMVDRMTKLWTNFAKYGDPTPETSDLLSVEWKPMTNEKHYYLNMDSELTLESRPFHGRMAFWDLFYKLYGKYQKWYEAPSV